MMIDLCHKFAQRLIRPQQTSLSSSNGGSFSDFLLSLHSQFTLPSYFCFIFRPSLFFFFGTMPSADFCHLSLCLHRGLPTQSACWQISPGNCAPFPLMCLLYLLSVVLI